MSTDEQQPETSSSDQDRDRDEPRTNQITRRDAFGGVSLAHENAATQSLVAKATADIQARWVMAMRRPREMNDVRQAMLKECKRQGFALVAIYTVPRGGNQIRGLSIRFAEVAMRCMGNMSCEAQTIFDSDEERIVRVIATDFETNTTWPRDITVKKTVERKQLKRGQRALRDRINSFGDRIFIVEATDDEVATKEAALISKAARTAILRLIPGHLQDEMYDVCDKIAKDQAAKDPDGEKNKILDAFAGLNIMPRDLAEWLGHAFEQTTPAEVAELRKLYSSLADGESTWADALEHAADGRERAKGPKTAAPAKAASAAAPAQPAAKTEPSKTPTPAPTPTPAKESPAATPTPTPAAAPPKAGKGTAAVKESLKAAPKPADPAPAVAVETSKTTATATLSIVPPATATDPTPPADDDLDVEDRACAKCGVTIETLKSAEAGQRCYSCRQGD